MLLYVLDPVADIFEALPVGHIVYQQNTHGTAVVRLCNSAKAFLTCRIPDLQFDSLAIHFNCTDLEINSNRRNKASLE